MKNYKQITYKYLKQQRNRTLLTILGIILSVAMISSIGTIIEGARNTLIQNAIKENGSYHVGFSNLDAEKVYALKNHVGIEKIGLSKKEGASQIAKITEEEREMYRANTSYRYIEVVGYDEEAFNLLPYEVSEGRMPKNSKEIIIEKWMIKYFNREIKLGDTLTLPLGNRKLNQDGEETDYQLTHQKEYTIVGFIEPKLKWSGNLITKGITGLDEDQNLQEGYDAYFQLTNIKDAEKKAHQIAKDIGLDTDNLHLNNKLLRLSAESTNVIFNETMILILSFIVGLIVVSTIAVIYNAFNISVLERISQFGLLRSVGATPAQIRGIVLKEAFILSGIGIPIGFLSGIAAMKIVFYVISKMKFGNAVIGDIEANISLTVLLISTVIGLATVFLSAIGPARKAGKVSPLEAVRNTGSFKKESFSKVRQSFIVRRLLGVEGEIAYKNLRRNRKRFIITVFSMVISISLFITFSSFSDYIFKAGIIDSTTTGDFVIFMEDVKEFDNIFREVKALQEVERVYKLKEVSGEAWLKDNKVNEVLMESMPNISEEKKGDLLKIHNIKVYTIGDENLHLLKSVLQEGTISEDALEDGNGVLVINNTYVRNPNTGNRRLIEGYSLELGDDISFLPYDFDGKAVDPIELKVMGVLEKGILQGGYNLNGGIDIITTEGNFEKILGSIPTNSASIIIEMEENFDPGPIRSYLEEKEATIPYFYYVDYAKVAEEGKAVSIISSIFLYGFVVLITLISSINIINTISTNIILRTRELAMIKAVGMSQKSIKRMVALESLFYGLYAAVFGGTIGTGLSYIVFNLVIRLSEFQWTIPWKNLMIACVGATIVALFSGILPLKAINEGIIVENMKMDE